MGISEYCRKYFEECLQKHGRLFGLWIERRRWSFRTSLKLRKNLLELRLISIIEHPKRDTLFELKLYDLEEYFISSLQFSDNLGHKKLSEARSDEFQN